MTVKRKGRQASSLARRVGSVAAGAARDDERQGRHVSSCTVKGRTVLVALALSCLVSVHAACRFDSRVPKALGDDEFWRMIESFSEPAGEFTHSENLVSNEPLFAETIRWLRPRGGVYIGVGPEQNFSFIARLRPAMAFVVDVRRENRNLHLMYKALFEISGDRADFLSRLFSRERPASLAPDAGVRDIFSAFALAKPAVGLRDGTAALIRRQLLDTHRFPLTPEDLAWIDHALGAFHDDGPDIHYGRSRPNDAPSPSYRTLMTARDVWGHHRSYLATEEDFAHVKDLHSRNLIVPLVGDFAGPRAIRQVGEFIRRHETTLSAFYGSNVEVYLRRAQMPAFCGNLASLPYDGGSSFIANKGMRRFESKLKACAAEVK